MEYYLLFDSECSTCTALAHAIEIEAGGRLTARSLHEPKVQGLLNRGRPGWRWEPTLLEANDAQVQVYTGLRMRLRLVQVLGLRRAWRVARLVCLSLSQENPREDTVRRLQYGCNTGVLAGKPHRENRSTPGYLSDQDCNCTRYTGGTPNGPTSKAR